MPLDEICSVWEHWSLNSGDYIAGSWALTKAMTNWSELNHLVNNKNKIISFSLLVAVNHGIGHQFLSE